MAVRYSKIDNKLFIKNRKKFMEQMDNKALAVFNSNDTYPTSADGTLAFKQHSDIFYLSGVDQEESILLLFPHAFDENQREILFLKETNEHIAVWEGDKLNAEEAYETSGIKTVYWLQDFDRIFGELMAQAEIIYFNTNEHTRANKEVETREDRFIKSCKNKFPAHEVRKSAPILHRIRSVKEPEEIAVMQEACDITEEAFRKVLKMVKPGVNEFEIEAEILKTFVSRRSSGFAYTPIIASGASACVLHYVDNAKACKDGELILMDFGAYYANYAADQTRCIPVNGKFTERQKQIYNAVLKVKNDATDLLRPGVFLGEYHKEVGRMMESALIDLKLLDKNEVKNQDPKMPAYKKYFMHGTSHFIGLDVHDVGLWTEPLQENMVFTVEPGIYIREEGLGVRLEDDVVVQKSGAPKNLMSNIPIEVDEIEELMNS